VSRPDSAPGIERERRCCRSGRRWCWVLSPFRRRRRLLGLLAVGGSVAASAQMVSEEPDFWSSWRPLPPEASTSMMPRRPNQGAHQADSWVPQPGWRDQAGPEESGFGQFPADRDSEAPHWAGFRGGYRFRELEAPGETERGGGRSSRGPGPGYRADEGLGFRDAERPAYGNGGDWRRGQGVYRFRPLNERERRVRSDTTDRWRPTSPSSGQGQEPASPPARVWPAPEGFYRTPYDESPKWERRRRIEDR